jgi:monoamine oxidase
MEKRKIMTAVNKYDVAIIGAGAAGLMAGLELALAGKKIIILEAKELAGGRMHTIEDDRFDLPVEMGAEFIHGKLEVTLSLLKKSGIHYRPMEGDVWRKEKGKWEKSDFIEDYADLQKKFVQLKEDMPVAEFLRMYLHEEKYTDLRRSLEDYVSGYYAADPERASTFALRDELQDSDEEQYRVEGGYKGLTRWLVAQVIEKGGIIAYSSPVHRIDWKTGDATVQSTKTIKAKKVLVTVSLGLLQNESIKFFPALPGKLEAAQRMGFGPAMKIMLQFDEAFWTKKDLTEGKDLGRLGFLFSNESVPTWWTHYPTEVAQLTGWLGGSSASNLKDLSDEAILEVALQSLANLFPVSPDFLKQNLKGWKVANWIKDPFVCGGYSFETVDSAEAKKVLQEPEDSTVFFAGEALHKGIETGTVEAALINGRDTAQKIIASF